MKRNEVLIKFSEFINIKSVSTNSKYFNEINLAVDFLAKWLKKINFKTKIIRKKGVPPLIISERIVSKQAKTIGIYCHYDVQPEGKISDWKTHPFKLTLKTGKFYGRGTADDKGHIIQSLTAVDELIRENKLKNNIVFILEGEEEPGSANFETLINNAKNILSKIDVFYILDMGMHEKNIPQIFYGLRGTLYFELNLETGKKELHSGVYGNQVINPAQILASILAKIKNINTGKINIPHFYDKVRKIDNKEVKLLKLVIRNNKEEKKEAGVYKIITQDNIHQSLIAKIYPSFDINGIYSGYTEEGIKSTIPCCATAKFSFRLVEFQDKNEIEKLIKNFIKINIPKGVKYKLSLFCKDSWFFTDINNEYMQTTAKIFSKFFGNKTLFNRSGASITAAEVFQRLFNKPVILTGFTLPDENIHAPNENFDEEMFWKGIDALKILLS